jgi:hypothetical protein
LIAELFKTSRKHKRKQSVVAKELIDTVINMDGYYLWVDMMSQDALMTWKLLHQLPGFKVKAK